MSYRRLLLFCLLLPFLAGAAPAAEPDITLLRRIEEVFASVAERVKPAVVSIRAERLRAAAAPREGEGETPPHPEVPRFATGSGVVIDPQGYILTNNHVVSDAEALIVRLSDNSPHRATVVGADPYTDLALLKIDAGRPLAVAKLGNSDLVKVGQWSIAVGDPFGITRTFTVGVVSGIGRSGVGVARYEYFIQTDAAINRGNSGGPLLNIDGEVIGINTAIPSPGSGLGFSIPINMAKDVITHLRSSGQFLRGYLGVTIQPVGDDMVHILGLPRTEGALVGSLLPDGPAKRAGVEVGDVIVGLDGKEIRDTAHLQRLVGWTPPGRAVKVEVMRNGQRRNLDITLAVLPGEARPRGVAPAPKKLDNGAYGMKLENLTPELVKQNQLESREGILIREVENGSRAFHDGLRPGMVIRELIYRSAQAGAPPIRTGIRSLEDLERLLQRLPAGTDVIARLVRGTNQGERSFFTVLHSLRGK
ncbi:MAG: trypsin-like peptidase domain-containing protein [Candidatus Tectomicrobia bacterium]|nr:trypsin-like peptidase domain-containing protein [Candidatus Tectomicrobia bacterium]